jgi:hypothetical protein
MLFSAYRRDDFADPEGFVAQLGVVLSDFSDEVVVYVTSPRTGLQRRLKWPPTINEVIEACEEHRDYLTKVRNAKPITRFPRLDAPPPQPGDLATIFVPAANTRYPSLVTWAKTAEDRLWKFGKSSDGRDGIWVAYGIWEQRATVAPRGQTFPEPKSLMLSEAARKVMRDVDAERNGEVPTHPTEEAA